MRPRTEKGYQRATFAGLLTGLIGLVVDQVSWVLLVVLLWHAVQHNLLQSSLENDFH